MAQVEVKIEKKVTEFTLPIKLIYGGKNKISFSARPSCTYGLNNAFDGTIQCLPESEKRKKLLESISKRKEKLTLSFIQETFKEAGFAINNESDTDEE